MPDRYTAGLFGLGDAFQQFPRGGNPILEFLRYTAASRAEEEELQRREREKQEAERKAAEELAERRRIELARLQADDAPWKIFEALGAPEEAARVRQRFEERQERQRAADESLRRRLAEEAGLDLNDAEALPLPFLEDLAVHNRKRSADERDFEQQKELARENDRLMRERFGIEEAARRRRGFADSARKIIEERYKEPEAPEPAKSATFSAIKAEADLAFERRFGKDPDESMDEDQRTAYDDYLDAAAQRRGIDLAELTGAGDAEKPPKTREELMERLRAAGAPQQVLANAPGLLATMSPAEVWALFLAGP